MVVPALLVGCAFFSPPKAQVDVRDIEAAFPTMQRLAVGVYWLMAGGEEDECEYFQYSRGAFTSRPDDCRVFDYDDRQPGGGAEGPVPDPFDEQARFDVADMLAAFEGVGAPLDYINVVVQADGSVGPDSNFSFDRCVMYVYDPGWTTLPEADPDSIAAGVNTDWYSIDDCP